MAGPPIDPIAAFQQQERAAIVLAVEKLLDELDRLAQVGNDTLRPRLRQLLGGHARATLLARVQAAHENLPAVDEHYRDVPAGGTRRLAAVESAGRALPAIARPRGGARPAGDHGRRCSSRACTLRATWWARPRPRPPARTAGHLATEAAIAGGITGGGEALVSSTSEGVRQAAGRLFGRLQSRYAQQRAGWLAEWLERELLGDLLADLRRGAEVPQSAAFREVSELVNLLLRSSGG